MGYDAQLARIQIWTGNVPGDCQGKCFLRGKLPQKMSGEGNIPISMQGYKSLHVAQG